jgi:hypothetical protein
MSVFLVLSSVTVKDVPLRVCGTLAEAEACANATSADDILAMLTATLAARANGDPVSIDGIGEVPLEFDVNLPLNCECYVVALPGPEEDADGPVPEEDGDGPMPRTVGARAAGEVT